jgi:hypothetical protein
LLSMLVPARAVRGRPPDAPERLLTVDEHLGAHNST